jgi:hypothetical protein
MHRGLVECQGVTSTTAQCLAIDGWFGCQYPVGFAFGTRFFQAMQFIDGRAM